MINLGTLCPDSIPRLFGVFDISIAPPLLFYSYIPIIFLSVFFGFYVYINDNHSLRSKLLLYLSITFALLLLNEILMWIASPANLVLFGWQLVPVFRLLVCLFTVTFVAVFIEKDKIPTFLKCFIGISVLTVVILLSTNLNIKYFDLLKCEGIYGFLWQIIHFFEILSVILILFIGRIFFINKNKNASERKEVVYLILGAVLFLLIFFAASIWGDLTKVYDIALIGPVGMLAFIGYLTFMIIRYKTFNIKLIAAQALVVALIILIGSQFFFIQNNANKILTAITLFVTFVIGINLVRSVKKEAALVEQLELANVGQKNLIHIMNHQIKGYLTVSKNIFAELLTDDFGKIPEDAKEIVSAGLENTEKGVRYVAGILQGDSAESGSLSYDMKTIDFKKLVSEAVAKGKTLADKKGLKFSFEIGCGEYEIIGDMLHLGEAVRNLIENSINYTPNGSIDIKLSTTSDHVLFVVKDTGVGVKDEDKPKLFKAGGVGSESIKVNANSSGYGLAFVKGVIEKHKGKVWFDSDGMGKGSTFYIELPIK